MIIKEVMIKRKYIKMKRAAGLSLLLLSLLTLKVTGQITGAVITPSSFNVGTDLTAGYTGTPESGNHVDYEWFYSPSGTSIGSSATYTIPASDQGKIIYITATEKLADNTPVRSFSSGNTTVNSYPVASYVGISGTTRSGMILHGSYVYSDADSDPENGTVFQWYRGTSPGGAGQTAIGSALSSSYTLTDSDNGYYIGFSVTPSSSSGSVPGSLVTTAVWTGPVVANSAPAANGLSIQGTLKVGSTLTAKYIYSDTEGDIEGNSLVEWFRDTNGSGTTWISIAAASTIKTYTLTNSEYNKLVRFVVTPVAQTGTANGSPQTSTNSAAVTNPPPIASSVAITGPGTFNVNDVLTGNYDYTDNEGDIEDGSIFKWYRSATTNSSDTSRITGASGIAYKLALSDTGKYIFFKVTPVAKTGGTTGSPVISAAVGTVNTPPYVASVSISGSLTIGTTLTGVYVYHDGDNDPQGTSIFRWFRDGILIPSATAKTYLLAIDDETHKMTFEVTPVSLTGYPNTGIVQSYQTSGTVTDPSPDKPAASQVCIEGVRAKDAVLTGKYKYTFPSKAEGVSTYRWLHNGNPISGATLIQYTLKQADIDSGEEITFEVTPISSNNTPKVGSPVPSNPLARIMLAADSYSIADSPVTLAANVGGGVFSGTGVSSGKFSPAIAGTAGSPFTITYYLPIVNTNTTCSQTASAKISVLPISSYFSSFRNFYCHDGGKDTIYVENVPLTATSLTFKLSNPNGIAGYIGDKAIIIDPAKMRPGNKVDTLYFTYIDGGSKFPVSRPLVIDSVGNNVALLNINPAYCEGSAKKLVTVGGTYPGGGSGLWTGLLMTDQTATTAFLDPTLGTAGTDYTITYQYTSPIGCKSALLSSPVKINFLPNSSFLLDATYNIDGGSKDLVPSVSGGNFVGSGVIGTKFYPDIAGQGSPEIKYYLTDINGCSSNTSHTTEVRKVQGIYNNLPSLICYRDTTYNISVTSLPGGISINDFTDSKNKLIHITGANASFKVAAAGAGYDTVKFSYNWDGVKYTLSKTVFVDSIGKVVISGLKDNYCDYEGTANLRVFVENSTGSGNFSFSGPAIAFANYGNLADFYPSKAPTSAIPYLVRYTHVSTVNNSGCRKIAELPVTVNKSPSVSIVTSRVTVNYEESPFVLEGLPTDGIFSGKGIYKIGTDYIFNPMVAGLGNIEIMLSYVDSKSCYSSVKDTLLVTVSSGTIEGINTGYQYCFDGPADTLKYVSGSPWLFGQFVGDGLTNISADQAVFKPSVAGKGDHKIVFRYFDLTGTIFEVPATLKVDSIGLVSVSNLKDGDIFCNNQPPFQLFGSNQGGVFSGPVTGSMLDASKGLGNTFIGYTYTNPKSGCSSSVNIPILINPAPVLSFAPNDFCIESDHDSTAFVNNTVSTDAVKTWLWQFSEAGGSYTSDRVDPKYLYKAGGLHKVILNATTVKDCSATLENTIDLGVKPVANFTWKNECYHTGDYLSFIDNTISSSTISSRRWNFFDGDSIHTVKNPQYPQKSVGWLKVEYIVNTNYTGCNDTITRDVFVRPTIVLASGDSSFENFESGNGGWVKDYRSVNNWTFGTPNRNVIKGANSGTSAWYTGYNITKRDTAFYSVVSPCYDFTNINRPMIRLKMWKRFEQNRNGASLQYMIGDAGTWEYVGTLDDGIRWFNSALIGRPGANLLGWTTTDPGWTDSRHKLDWLQGKKDVKFRISYGSDGTSNTDGIAFDDIWIGERSRNLLLEHFENTSSLDNSNAKVIVDTLASRNKKDVINIQYHTNFPGPDPYYNDNPGDVSARVLFYGLARSPYSFVDGGFNKSDKYAGLYDYYLSTLDSIDIIRRSLTSPLFKIAVSSDVSNGILTVGGKITALGSISNAENMTMYIAVTEKKNSDHTGFSGEQLFYYVFRKMIPDAGGINLKKTWAKGEEMTIPDQSWVIQKIKSSTDIVVIVFLQNNITKEVYQASSQLKPNIATGIEKTAAGKGNSFSLFPNPAVNKLTIDFSEKLTGDADIKIYDLQGLLVSAYKAGSGISEYTIENLKLKAGIYLVRLSREGVDLGFRKLIITGD
jgi:hypothetical protein